MLEPALKFVETPYHPNDRGNILLRFRERGFATLGNVFQPETVDAYLDQIKSLVVEGKEWWNPLVLKSDDPITVHPARAPRLIDVLRGGFMPWIAEPMPVLMSGGWLVKPSNPDEKLVHDWHKDGDHIGATCAQGYTFPQVIHTAIYFADMTPDLGPTYVIPRSHRDPTLSPFGGAKEEPFLPGKGDVVIWDQRLWHRASPRTVPGMRIVAIFAFYPVPIVEHRLRPSAAQLAAFKQAGSEKERILFGGPVEM
jgi:hypothetical protein